MKSRPAPVCAPVRVPLSLSEISDFKNHVEPRVVFLDRWTAVDVHLISRQFVVGICIMIDSLLFYSCLTWYVHFLPVTLTSWALTRFWKATQTQLDREEKSKKGKMRVLTVLCFRSAVWRLWWWWWWCSVVYNSALILGLKKNCMLSHIQLTSTWLFYR